MSVKWTQAQRDAIEDTGGTLLVSAAAGSGKTAVLVERAVRMLTDEGAPVAADRLLIVTFTRAAAQELRGRISVRLAECAAKNPASAWLRKQRILLGRANISTIDAYCSQLLHRYFAELALPSDFGLADDATAFALRQGAMSEVLEAFYADVDFCAFASLYGRARSDANASGAVMRLYDFLRSLPNALKALEEMCQSYENDLPLGETPWGGLLLRSAGENIRHAQRLTASAREMIAAEPLLEKYEKAFASDAAGLDTLQTLLAQDRWDDAAVCAQNFAFERLGVIKGYEGDTGEIVKQMRDGVKKDVSGLRKNILICSQADFDEDRKRIAPMLRALARAVTAFGKAFFDAKIAEKALEYSDFEHLALKLLCDENGEKTAIARAVSRNFDAVMVDEYQDTNALQTLLYHCLANDDASNLFFVGDVKQSIYRFRLAEPGSFIEKRESFAAYQRGGAHPATIVLGHNFRSAGSVIDSVNDVFACLMSKELGDVEYNASEALVAGGEYGYDGGALEIKIVDKSTANADCADAAVVAKTICDRVKSGFLVRDKKGGTRPCRWDDFCILLRSRSLFTAYAAALAACSVPAFADTGESWLTSSEVSALISMLRAIDNPGQDIHLAAVMLSPMFGFVPDDLTAVRAAAPKLRLFPALLASENVKIQEFCAHLRALRTLGATAPIDVLCGEIMARTNYFAAVGAMENGAARRDNLRAFTAWATALANSGMGGLAGFLRHLDDALESGGLKSANPPAPPAGSVAIMTIHRSKGLEFPVCILADTARRFNLRDASNPILFHPKYGIGFNLRAEGGGMYATAPHCAIRFAERNESISEEMRILYVALTRARDKLIVSVPLENPYGTLQNIAVGLMGTRGADAFTLAGLQNFASWMCTVALLHPDSDNLREICCCATLPLIAAKGELCAEIVPSEEVLSASEAPAFVRTAAVDEDLRAALLANFAYQNPSAALCNLPRKVSVSALTHGNEEMILARPSFLYKEGLTAAESGTAQHAFLQFADFAAARRDLESELARLVREKYLDETLAEKIPLGAVQTFLASDMCARIQNADTLLREYEFLTAVPAKFIAQMDEEFEHVPVQVQGIADAVLLNREDNTAEIVDYKTDKGKTPEQFLDAYAKQLRLYKAAVERRLLVKVTRCTIYSFALGAEIDVVG